MTSTESSPKEKNEDIKIAESLKKEWDVSPLQYTYKVMELFYDKHTSNTMKYRLAELFFVEFGQGAVYVENENSTDEVRLTHLLPQGYDSFNVQLDYIKGSPEFMWQDSKVVNSVHMFCIELENDLHFLPDKYKEEYKKVKNLLVTKGAEIENRNFFLGKLMPHVSLPPWDQHLNVKKIAENTFASIVGDKVYISDGTSESAQKIESLLLKLENINDNEDDDKTFQDRTIYEHELEKYLQSPEKNDFFVTSSNLSQEDVPGVFQFMSRPEVRKIVEETFQINLHHFTFPEQLQIFEYLYSSGKDEVEKIQALHEKNGDDFLKSFVSQEQDKAVSKTIVQIADSNHTELSRKIFSIYVEITRNVQDIVNFIHKNFKKKVNINPEMLETIRQTLFTRANNFLKDYGQRLEDTDTIEKLSRISADTATALAVFKHSISVGAKLPLEMIVGASFSKKKPSDFSEEQQKEMRLLYEKNWTMYPNKEFVEHIISYFDNAFEANEKNEFYTFEKDGHIHAFVRFEEKDKHIKYASALNVDDATKGFGLGESMMEEAIAQEAKKNILLAKCDPFNENNMRYFEKGFVARGFTEDVPVMLDIIWNEKENTVWKTKTADKNLLIEEYLKGRNEEEGVLVQRAEQLKDLFSTFPENKILTRCFKNPVGSGWYAVYEDYDQRYFSYEVA